MRLTRAAACRSIAGSLLALSLASGTLADARPATVLDLAAQQKNLTTFVAAVHTAGLDETLRAAGPFTVYAPSDQAFAKMPAADRAALLASPDRLKALVLDHVAKDIIRMNVGDSWVSSGAVTNIAGRDLPIGLERERSTIGGAHLLSWDLRADNGSLNVIDKVLLP